jgi:transglutaminase-like putative cysteine protease
MQKTWYFNRWNQCRLINAVRVALGTAVVFAAAVALAGTPDWLKQVAQEPLPAYSGDTDAVVLLDETVTNVSATGEVHTTYRKAYKILRPQGRARGTVHVYFDSETRLTFLKAWGITTRNEEYEVKESDAVETTLFSESLYADTRYKSLQIPAAQPGSVVGYEYQQRGRQSVLQTLWLFQDEIPVRRARFVLELPPNWSYAPCWRNHAALTPQQNGENRWSWELADVEPIRPEPQMPNWRSVAGALGISFAPKDSASSGKSYSTWAQIGRWYAGLTAGRRDVTPEIRDKTRQLVEGVADPLEKIGRLASYVQHDIRYVSIEIGIGGYMPHSAAEVFANRYGDCKDKATLLSTMLREAGIDSYYVLINDEREFLSVEFPTPLNFNHVILAIRLPKAVEAESVFATLRHEKLGTLLLFDPTDSSTPIGYLPSSLQANYGLLVTHEDGELAKLPLLPPSVNLITRVAKLNIDSSGKLTGTVQEIRTGPAATALREQLLAVPNIQRQKVFQNLLSNLFDGAVLTSALINDLSDFSRPFSISYGMTANAYAQHSGRLFLFRSCALGHKGGDLLESKPRQQPVVFSHTAYESDTFDLSYPAEYSIDELPQAVKYEYPFATYKSELHADGHVLHYTRTYELRAIRVPVQQLDSLKQLFRQIADDERAYTILVLNASPLVQPNGNQGIGLVQDWQRLRDIRLFINKGYSELLQLAPSLFSNNEALEVRLAASECLRNSCVESKRKNVHVSDNGYDG